ncbi:hypothetical protein Are01nite_01500 [Actinoplanes regularis]|nr:hypothetical protein Are01nite_01500 [Actinoplanes regularis]
MLPGVHDDVLVRRGGEGGGDGRQLDQLGASADHAQDLHDGGLHGFVGEVARHPSGWRGFPICLSAEGLGESRGRCAAGFLARLLQIRPCLPGHNDNAAPRLSFPKVSATTGSVRYRRGLLFYVVTVKLDDRSRLTM